MNPIDIYRDRQRDRIIYIDIDKCIAIDLDLCLQLYAGGPALLLSSLEHRRFVLPHLVARDLVREPPRQLMPRALVARLALE